MKKFLLLIAILCFAFAANAQTFNVLFNNTVVNNDTVSVMPEYGIATMMATIHNNTDHNIQAQCTCIEVAAENMTVEAICAGECQPGNTSAVFTVNANSDFTEGVFDIQISTNRATSNGLFMMKLYDTEDAMADTVVVFIRVVVESNSITENTTANLVNAYPNPATNQVNISYSLPENCTNGKLMVCDILGSVMGETMVSNTNGTVQVDVTNYPAGVYMYGIVANNKMLSMKKFVVK